MHAHQVGTGENADMKKLNCIQFVEEEDAKKHFLLFCHHSGCLATEMRSLQALRIFSLSLPQLEDIRLGKHSRLKFQYLGSQIPRPVE